MIRRSKLSLLAVVALSLPYSTSAQDNLNNMGEVNGANSIEDSKKSSGNSSNNVLDSEELNASSNNSAPKNNSNNSSSQLNNTEGGGNGADLNADLNSDGGKNSANGNLANDALNNSKANDGGAGTNGSADFGNTNTGNGAGLGGLNGNNLGKNKNTGGLNNPNTGGASNSANLGKTNSPSNNPAPPPNSAQTPGTADTPPPPQETPPDPAATATNSAPPPDASAAPTAEAPSEPPAEAPKKMSAAEKRQARLELIKKMAESIPALRPGEGPLEYTVQPGDTLWDIADQLLDDAMWWPRLWVLNPEVTDPDKIEPGIRLVFYPGSADKSPELAVQDAADPFGPSKIDLATLQTFSMDTKRWTGPTGEFVDPRNLPGDQNLLSIGEPMINATYMFRLPGFYAGSDPGSVGEIISNPNNPLIAGQGQNLVAQFDRSPNPGERFHVLRETPALSGLDPVRPDGTLYAHVGSVGVVRASPNGYATLVAEDNGSYVSPNDILVPANKNLYVPVAPNEVGRPNQAAAYVVATEGGQYQSAGPGIAVYLQGVDGRNPFSVGDDVELFMPIGGNFGFASEKTPREKVAVARIVDARPESAVGVIIRASREVTAGASTSPTMFDEW